MITQRGPIQFLRFVRFACIRHYFPRLGRTAKPRLAPRSGTLTPPRISPNCPRCVNCGWAGVPLKASEVIAKRPARADFGWMEPLGTLSSRHLRKPELFPQVVLAHPPYAGPLRRGLHPANLYPQHEPSAGRGGGHDGEPGGAKPVTEETKNSVSGWIASTSALTLLCEPFISTHLSKDQSAESILLMTVHRCVVDFTSTVNMLHLAH